jgi:plastocyanin
MRNLAVLVTAVLIAVLFVVPPSIPDASAAPQTTAVAAATKLYLTVGVDPGGNVRFVPDTIIIPQVNITLNVTFTNNYTLPGMNHTFTIANSDQTSFLINTRDVAPGKNVSFEFHINSMTNITNKTGSFTPESSGLGIRWYCLPHRSLGMQGQILLAGLTTPAPEKGILLRAYWIGIIGIAVTLAWTGVSYFLIKSSSHHFKDQREHVRKGLP